MSFETGAVDLSGVDKWFEPYRRSTVRRAVPGPYGEPTVVEGEGTFALRGIDLHIPPGQAVGIIGHNGAGKSTLLRLLAGISAPTSGSIQVGGRLAAIIELGVGLHPDLTGWENMRLAAALRGIPRAGTAEFIDEVAEFSGLGEALEHPLKHYSTGMAARLGFSVATHCEADVLAVDEAISVGDREFQIRCLDRIRKLLAQGVTLLFVSHDLWLVSQLCERAVVFEHGRVTDDGDPSVVIPGYLARLGQLRPADAQGSANRGLKINDLRILNPVIETQEKLALEMDVELARPGTGLRIETSLAFPPFGPFASSTQRLPPDLEGAVTLRGYTDEVLAVGRGEFEVSVAVLDGSEVLSRASAPFALTGEDRRRPFLMVPFTHRWDRADPRADVVPEAEHLGDAAIRVEELTKRFDDRNRHRLRRLIPLPYQPTGALVLDDVSLDVAPGGFLGIIGPNGAGKSTILKVIAGITRADRGSVGVEGRVVSMIELGVGFHPDLTGDENIYLAGLLLGLEAEELDDLYQEIVDFSGVRHAMSEPVKHFSTGMVARLGFALASHVPADVLLVDEMLSVGDAEFRDQAIERMQELSRLGTTIVLVSHDYRLIAEVCQTAVLLVDGRVEDRGLAEEVVERFGGTDLAQADPMGYHRFIENGSLRLAELTLTPQPVAPGGELTITMLLETTGPVSNVRLDLCIAAPFDSDWVRTGDLNEVYDRSLVAEDLPIDPRIFGEAGRWKLTASVGCGSFRPGVLDVVIIAVDELSGEILSEARRPVRVRGQSGERVGILLDTTWASVPSGTASHR